MDNGGHHLPRPGKQTITPHVALRGRSTSLFCLCIIYSIRTNYNYNKHQICTHNILNISPGRRAIPFKDYTHCILTLIITCIFSIFFVVFPYLAVGISIFMVGLDQVHTGSMCCYVDSIVKYYT